MSDYNQLLLDYFDIDVNKEGGAKMPTCPGFGDKAGKCGKEIKGDYDYCYFCNQAKFKKEHPEDSQPPAKSNYPKKDEREARERSIIRQTCLKCVAMIYHGRGQDVTEETMEKRFRFFLKLAHGND